MARIFDLLRHRPKSALPRLRCRPRRLAPRSWSLSLEVLEHRWTPSGEPVSATVGTLPLGRSVAVRFQATVDSPLTKGINLVYNQGTVTGTNFAAVKTDDPSLAGATDPVTTAVDRPPAVAGVFVRGTAWTATYLGQLQTAGLGSSTFGYALPAGAGQAATLPWANLDRVSVRFTENVTVAADDLQVFGAATATYPLVAASFAYDAATFTATWAFAAPLAGDKLKLDLDGTAATGVTQFHATLAADRKPLDGEWTDGTAAFNSGDGAPGGDFVFRLNVQPGDVNGDGLVNVTDAVIARSGIGGTNRLLDLDGDGAVAAADGDLARGRIGQTQPAGTPGGPAGGGWVAATAPTPPVVAGAAGTSVTATIAGALVTDLDGDGVADPGDTVQYTLTVANVSLSPTATGVAFNETLDPRMTLVTGSVAVSPIAVNDSYAWVGNTLLDSAARGLSSLTANDADPDSPFSIDTTFTPVVSNGGTVTVNADGSFTYVTAAGYTGATETFTYRIKDAAGLTSTATATVNLSGRVWYVQGGATNGDGRSNTPFNSPASASTAANLATDIIYVLSSGTAVNGAFTLDNSQQLLGQGVALTVSGINLFAAGAAPTLTNTGGNTITLGQTNTVRGLVLGDTSGVAVTGATVGTLTLNAVTKSGTGRVLDIDGGTLAVAFDKLTSTSSSGGAAVNLNNVGGSLAVTNGTGTDTSIAGAAAGISITNAVGAATFAFGDAAIGSSGTGLNLGTNGTATTSFASLAVTTTAGAGIVASTGGTLTIAGTANTVSASGGPALNLAGTTLGGGATFATVSSSGSPTQGIRLDTVTGNLTMSGGSITAAAGVDFTVNAGSSDVTYAGSVTNTAGRSVEVTGRAGGTVTLAGAIDDTGAGTRFFGNGTSTVTFSNAVKALHTGANTALNIDGNGAGFALNFTGGGLDVTTSTAAAVTASGSGTLTVTGSGNSIVTTGAAAAIIANGITFGAGTAFATVTSAGGTSNISLTNVGGTLTMSGGTLSGSTGPAFTLTGGNAAVTYNGTISVTNGQSGVVTSNPTGGSLTLGTVNVSNTGAANNNDAVVIDGNGTNAFDVTIASATLNATNMNDALSLSDLVSGSDITISGGTLTAAAAGDRVVNFATALNANVNLSGATLNGTNSDGLDFTGTVQGTYQFGAYTANTPNGGIALEVTAGVATVTFASLSQSGGTTGVSITGATTGAVTINGGAISGTSGTDFSVTGVAGATGNVTYAGKITNAAGNSVVVTAKPGGTVTFSGLVTDTAGSTGISLTNNTGATVTFSGGLSLTTTTNAAFTATGGGTVNVTDTAAITNAITTTTGTAVTITATTIGASGVTFDSVSTSGAANGILLDTVGANAFTANGGSIVNAVTRGVDVNGGTGNVTYAGTITTSGAAARSVEVTSHTGGTVLFSGAITDTSTGINLTGNTGATINFTGGLSLTTTTSAGFNATGGGTVTVQGSGNTINSTSATALNVANTTIGASGLNFVSISSGNNTAAADPVNGIVLNNTGTLGGLTVTGDGVNTTLGGNGSGGVIQNTSGAGIALNSTVNTSLSYVSITNPGTDGIAVTNINGWTLNRSTISDGSGTGPFDAAIDFNNYSSGDPSITPTSVNGTIIITNSIVGPASGNAPHNSLTAVVGSGTSTWSVTGSTFRRTGNSGINLELRNSAVFSSFLVDNCTFAGANTAGGTGSPSARGIFVNNLEDSVMTLLTIQNSTFTNNNIHIDLNQQNDTDPVGSHTFKVLNNTMTGARSHAMNIFAAAGSFGGQFTGTIQGNTIGNASVDGSGSEIGNGIRVNANGGTTATMLINNNTIREAPNGRGIEVIGRNGLGTLDITITNNNVDHTNLTYPIGGAPPPSRSARFSLTRRRAAPLGLSASGSARTSGAIRFRRRAGHSRQPAKSLEPISASSSRWGQRRAASLNSWIIRPAPAAKPRRSNCRVQTRAILGLMPV